MRAAGTPVLAVVTAALAATALTGCSFAAPERPAEVASAPRSASPLGREAPMVVPLTAEQAQAALLTVDDLPTGWTVEASGPAVEEPATTTEPPACAALFEGLDAVPPVAEAEATFSAGPLGPVIEQAVAGYDTPAAPLVEAAASAFDQCSQLTSIDAAGQRTELTAAPLSFPELGDATLALRLVGEVEGLAVTADAVYVAVGDDAVYLVSAGLVPLPGPELEALVGHAVTRLEQAAAAG